MAGKHGRNQLISRWNCCRSLSHQRVPSKEPCWGSPASWWNFSMEKIHVFFWKEEDDTYYSKSFSGNLLVCVFHSSCENTKKSISIYMDVSENSGTPKLSILMGFSIINHPFWGTPIFGNTHIQIWRKSVFSLLLRIGFLVEDSHDGVVSSPSRFRVPRQRGQGLGLGEEGVVVGFSWGVGTWAKIPTVDNETNLGWLGYIGDEILFFLNHYKDSY